MGLYTAEENGEIFFPEMIVLYLENFPNISMNLLMCSYDTAIGLSPNINSSR